MIYLHIGKSKTGTTTIQQGLKRNIERLLALNYLYPKTGLKGGGHFNIYHDLQLSNKFEPSLGSFRELLNEIKVFKSKEADGHVILSSEGFEALDNTTLSNFYKELRQLDEVTVLLVLRRQDKFLLSYWSMLVTRMQTDLAFGDWVEILLAENKISINKEKLPIDNSLLLDYDSRIKELEVIFEGASLRLLAYENLVKEGLFSSFLTCLDIEQEELTKFTPPKSANLSFDSLSLELIRNLNQAFGKKLTNQRREALVECIGTIAKRKNWKGIITDKLRLCSTSAYQQIVDRYKTSNRNLKENYPAIGDTLDFDAELSKWEPVTLVDIPQEDLLELSVFSLVRGIALGQNVN